MSKLPKLKVAIVHDWLVGGGAERVVFELHKLFPDAPIYSSYCSDEWRNKLDGKVITGFLQYWPFSRLRKFIPFLRIWWFGSLDFSDYDLVLSSSGAEAKGIKVPASTLHINYCYAATHYYWSRYEQYLVHPGFGPLDPLARIGLRLLVGPLRRWDYKAAQRPDYIVTISSYIRSEVKKYYGRDSVVIFPPVDIERFALAPGKNAPPRSGFVTAGRQSPYKRIDLAVAACSQLNLPLTVIGWKGPEHGKLTAMAGPSVTFLTNVPDSGMSAYFQRAEAFIFPSHNEDFGITAIEALAAGTPVIAFKGGGPIDYIVPNQTGLFFDKPTVESLVSTLQTFDAAAFNHAAIAKYATQFSAEHFGSQLLAFIESVTT